MEYVANVGGRERLKLNEDKRAEIPGWLPDKSGDIAVQRNGTVTVIV